MDIVTLDFETYYGADFTLSKLTTEAYVRDPRFEVIMCGVKRNDEPGYWIDAPEVATHLQSMNLENHGVLAHHAHFDGLILSHHYGIKPKAWFDTLSMARAIHGANGGLSLAKLAERYGIGTKGNEVIHAKDLHRKDFSPINIKKYGAYCVQDCGLARGLFLQLMPHFCKGELKLIDLMIRMFTEPVLQIDAPMLEEYAQDIRAEKVSLLLQAGIQLTDVMSNDKFAIALQNLGVVPPLKVSLTTGKETYAFAKTDPAMEALAEHPDEVVQALIAARLKNRSTINETRAQRMIDMIKRGPAPVYLKYYGASGTGRASGGDKMNWQNFGRGGKLRKSVMAPPEHEIVVGDSSNIEARVLDVLAGQEDAVQVYRDNDAGIGPDTYCVLAGKIYHRVVTKADKDERQLGKVAKLGLGYGMGAGKFVSAVRAMAKKVISEDMSASVVSVYRSTHPHVIMLWKRAEDSLKWIQKGVEGQAIDPMGIVVTCKEGILLPNGMKIRYPDLKYKPKAFGMDVPDAGWTFWNGKAREKIYGGKIVENIVQALARIVVMDQTLVITEWCAKKASTAAAGQEYRVVLSVHDEVVSVVPTQDAVECLEFTNWALRQPPKWMPNLPLFSEGGIGARYGDAK
jgi:DNA polymerase